MSTMKKFLKYFLIFLAVYVLVTFLSFQSIKSTYKNKNYTVNFEEPKIEVTEAKATITNGYVNGKITNNTDEAIVNKLLKFDFISPRGITMGTKYFDIGTLLPGETKNFTAKFNYDNVNDIVISLIDRTDVNLQDLDFSLDDLKNNKTNWPAILLAVFIFFGEDIVMVMPFL